MKKKINDKIEEASWEKKEDIRRSDMVDTSIVKNLKNGDYPHNIDRKKSCETDTVESESFKNFKKKPPRYRKKKKKGGETSFFLEIKKLDDEIKKDFWERDLIRSKMIEDTTSVVKNLNDDDYSHNVDGKNFWYNDADLKMLKSFKEKRFYYKKMKKKINDKIEKAYWKQKKAFKRSNMIDNTTIVKNPKDYPHNIGRKKSCETDTIKPLKKFKPSTTKKWKKK